MLHYVPALGKRANVQLLPDKRWISDRCSCKDTCGVISEKVPYCETNSVVLDQLFHTFATVFFHKHCTWSNKKCFL